MAVRSSGNTSASDEEDQVEFVPYEVFSSEEEEEEEEEENLFASIKTLSAYSPVFAAMFSHDCLEKKNRIVRIESAEGRFKPLKAFLAYIRQHNEAGIVDRLPLDVIAGVGMLIDKYQVQQLKSVWIRDAYMLINDVAHNKRHLQFVDLYAGDSEVNLFSTRSFDSPDPSKRIDVGDFMRDNCCKILFIANLFTGGKETSKLYLEIVDMLKSWFSDAILVPSRSGGQTLVDLPYDIYSSGIGPVAFEKINKSYVNLLQNNFLKAYTDHENCKMELQKANRKINTLQAELGHFKNQCRCKCNKNKK